MKNVFLLLLFCTAALSIQSCTIFKCGNNNTESYKEIAAEKLGPGFSLNYNSSKTYVLIVKQEKETASNPLPLLRFMLFEIPGNKLLIEDAVSAGNVKWINDSQIEISKIPGTVSVENRKKQSGYLFDVKTEKRTLLSTDNIK